MLFIFSEITCTDPSIQIKGSVGLVVVTSTLSIGGEAHYRCERGYTLKGNQSRTCLPKGQWNGTPPACLRKFQKKIVYIVNSIKIILLTKY